MPKKRRFEKYNNIYVKRLEDILENEKKKIKKINIKKKTIHIKSIFY